MQIITIEMKTALGPTFWKQEQPTHTTSNEVNITEYKKQLPPYNMEVIGTTQELDNQSLQFINLISQAKNKITKTLQEASWLQGVKKPTDSTSTQKTANIPKEELWTRIYDIQNKLEVDKFKQEHQNKQTKINCKENAKEFWETIKYVKQEIKHAITNYNKEANENDKEARDFIDMFPTEPDNQHMSQSNPDVTHEQRVSALEVQHAMQYTN